MTGNWQFVWGFLKTALLGVIGATLLMGVFGFLLAGVTGMLNMAAWGFALGLIGGPMAGGALMLARYAEEIGGNFHRWQAAEDDKRSAR